MSIYATNDTPQREIINAGNHVAICYSIVHIGTHMKSYLGSDEKPVNEVTITFELPNKRKEFDGVEKPMVIGKTYTLTLDERGNLRKDLQSWLGRNLTDDEVADGFDLAQMLGKSCLLNIIHGMSKKNTAFAKISNVSPLVEGMPEPERFNPFIEYSVANHNPETFAKLPKFIQDNVLSSLEWQAIANPTPAMTDKELADEADKQLSGAADNDLPF